MILGTHDHLACRALAVVSFLVVAGASCVGVAFAHQGTPSPGTDAGDTSARQAPGFTVRVTTREVLVEVVATDRHNHPLNNLEKSDFQIFEVTGHSQKVHQKVTSFRVIDPAATDPDSIAGGHATGFQLTLGGGCAEKTLLHYELAYHPSSDGWKSGYHEIVVTTRRRDIRLSFRHRYFVGETEAPLGALARNDAEQALALQEAACYHSATPLSIALTARLIETGHSDALRYFITVRADSLSFLSLSDETRRVQLDYGICTFTGEGKLLRYMHTSTDRVLTPGEYIQSQTHGFPNRIEFPRLNDPALARFVVRDRATGNVGAVDVPIAGPPKGEEKEPAEDWRALNDIGRTVGAHYVLGPVGSFGSIVPVPDSLCGDVYELAEGTRQLPNFWNLEAVGALHTSTLEIPPQLYTNTEGIPGISRRTEWFGIDYHGAFWVTLPGEYVFDLMSDDGSKLYIDDELILSMDGAHQAYNREGRITLGVGRHTIHLPYFEGPMAVALILLVRPPGGQLELFDMRKFTPPVESVKQLLPK